MPGDPRIRDRVVQGLRRVDGESAVSELAFVSDYDSLQAINALQGSYQVNFTWWEAGSPIYDELLAKYGLWTHHELRYDSALKVTDGQLDTRCFGCGDWDGAPGHATGGWCTGFYSL